MISAKEVAELRNQTGAGMMDCKKALTECNGDMEKALDYLREKGIAKATKKADRIAAEGLANVYIKDNKAVILEVNSETDFVSKNEEFTKMIDDIGNTILKSKETELDKILNLKFADGTINDLIISKTAKIGEKLSLRRVEVVLKKDNEVFGSYLHMGGRIAVLTLLEGANEAVAKDVAMQAAAMRPEFLDIPEIPSDRIEREQAVFKEQAINEGKPEAIAEKMVDGKLKKFYKEVCLIKQEFIKDGDIDIETYVKNNNGKVLKMIRFEVGEGMEHRNENFADEVMKQIG